MNEFPYPDEPTTIKAYQARVKQTYEDAHRAFPDPADQDSFRHFTRYGYSCGHMPEPQASDKHIAELEAELGQPSHPDVVPPVNPGAPTARPLVGALRIQDKLFRDDSGYRRVLFCSWFTALRVLRENPSEFARQIDAIAAAGYQGFRVFLAVGGWMGYWDNHEVAPISFQKWYYTGNHLRSDRTDGALISAWPDYDDLLRSLLRACRARGLRLHVTTGDMQIICGSDQAKELELHRRLSRICAEEGGLDVIALTEATNEYPINRYGGGADVSLDQMGRILDVWAQAIPGVLTAQGAVLSEEPDELRKSASHGNVCAVHTTRDPFSQCIKRTFGLVNWEGNWRAFPSPYWQGEPAGPGQDSYARQNDPSNLTALYAMHALTGQASNWFQGAAVRNSGPLESEWGFSRMPSILSVLPEDVGAWQHANNGRGGIMYFFSGNTFATASIADWDTSPPRPVASWTLYAGDQITQGSGTPPRCTGLLMGQFQ